MTAISKSNSLLIRLFAILIGMALLFWLPLENANETPAIMFAYCISACLTSMLILRSKNPSFSPILKIIFAGILTGALITPIILLLMVFKIGLHAHPIPDYTNEQFISIIIRTPAWFLSGFLSGLGLGMLINSIQIRKEKNRAN